MVYLTLYPQIEQPFCC